MKNVTIALDEETHRRARIHAAERGTSLSAMVKQYLEQVGASPVVESSYHGVREMPSTFTYAPSSKPAAGTLPPGAYGLFPDGTPYYTKDGKPRTAGALVGKIALADDADEWSPDVLAFFDTLQAEPFDFDSLDPLP
jgi:hypothetical protein